MTGRLGQLKIELGFRFSLEIFWQSELRLYDKFTVYSLQFRVRESLRAKMQFRWSRGERDSPRCSNFLLWPDMEQRVTLQPLQSWSITSLITSKACNSLADVTVLLPGITNCGLLRISNNQSFLLLSDASRKYSSSCCIIIQCVIGLYGFFVYQSIHI